jgi:hypothetical protein
MVERIVACRYTLLNRHGVYYGGFQCELWLRRASRGEPVRSRGYAEEALPTSRRAAVRIHPIGGSHFGQARDGFQTLSN